MRLHMSFIFCTFAHEIKIVLTFKVKTMSKYVRFTIVGDFGETEVQTESYKDAFSTYQKTPCPKTMYGYDEQANVSVIFSKG